VAPFDAAEKNRNMGAQLQSLSWMDEFTSACLYVCVEDNELWTDCEQIFMAA